MSPANDNRTPIQMPPNWVLFLLSAGLFVGLVFLLINSF